MRSVLKAGAEACLLALGADRVGRRWNRGRTLVLAYHNVVPDGQPASVGDRSLHLPQSVFARQLDLLSETHEIVPVSSLTRSRDPESEPAPSRPGAAITFDDAYRGALTAGLAELRGRGLPVTIFVSPDLLDREAFWWDLLSRGASRSEIDSLREYALRELGGRQDEILRWTKGEGRAHHPPEGDHARPATIDLLRTVAEEPGVTLASHGWSHASLPTLRREELAHELAKPLDWFESRDIPFERWIAFPYGRHSQRVREYARQLYSLAFTTAAGFTRNGISDRMAVPRMNVPAGMSLRSFQLETSGAAGLASGGLDGSA